ncbi:MAG: hypothetical protein H3C36_11630 [Chitinophagaceae bacterium]|nr:hypothetical protein [Chitinophagaceae bacterium]MCZ2395052.1 hypothetical protein [Chitinophagales bacterium]
MAVSENVFQDVFSMDIFCVYRAVVRLYAELGKFGFVGRQFIGLYVPKLVFQQQYIIVFRRIHIFSKNNRQCWPGALVV